MTFRFYFYSGKAGIICKRNIKKVELGKSMGVEVLGFLEDAEKN